MNRFLPKLVSASVVAFFWWLFLRYYDYEKWHNLGKDAFLTHEGSRFDKFYIHPNPATFVGAIALILLVIGVYEILAFLISKTSKLKVK